MTYDRDNKIASMASKFVNSTNKHIFLTGKAGTGKTTFLQRIAQLTHKETIVAAPTGIAAINAGGITLHSLFQLPFGSFVPENKLDMQNIPDFSLNTPASLLKNIQMHSSKRDMLRKLELLIIDEVSMLRADILDAIDTVLRKIRRRNQVFGGVQVLFIGDLQQLPPVVKAKEWEFLRRYYPTMFFFEAHALRNNLPLYIELEKIYRQTDQQFINILNNLRDNRLTKSDITTLNQYLQPGFKPKPEEGYIYLTTHNYKADLTNREELQELPGETMQYHAEISGKFDERIYPVDEVLELKPNAQVMFIKNDPTGRQQFFNGKIGMIEKLSNDEIRVKFNDGTPSVEVERYTWENIRYTLNKETNQIEEKVVGRFVHFPLKLAWAITIHKSQGLTFEKAILDVSQAFAAGQVYVALSRLTSLEGLVLTAPFRPNNLEQKEALKTFSQNKENANTLQNKYEQASTTYLEHVISEAFNFGILAANFEYHLQTYDKDASRSTKQKYFAKMVEIRNQIEPLKDTGYKFQRQAIGILYSNKKDNYTYLQQRLTAAKNYFEPFLKDFSKQINALVKKLKGTKGVKQYISELQSVELFFYGQLQKIYKAEALLNAIIENSELTREKLKAPEHEENIKIERKAKKKKAPQVNTREVTLKLFNAGKSIDEIANERQLAVSTISKHITYWVEEGVIDVYNILDDDDVFEITEAFMQAKTYALSPVKEIVGEKYSYNELRFVLGWMRYQMSITDEDDE